MDAVNSLIPVFITLLFAAAMIAIYANVLQYKEELRGVDRFESDLDGGTEAVLTQLYPKPQNYFDGAGIKPGYLRDLIEQMNAGYLVKRLPDLGTLRLMALSRHHAERTHQFVAFAASVCLILGILGTLIAIQDLFSGSGINEVLNSQGEFMTPQLAHDINKIYGGLSSTFISSICGIIATVILLATRNWSNWYRTELFRRLDGLATTRLFELFCSSSVEAICENGFQKLTAATRAGSDLIEATCRVGFAGVAEAMSQTADNNTAFSDTVNSLKQMVNSLASVGPSLADAAVRCKAAVEAFEKTFGKENALHAALNQWLALGSAVQETNAKQSDWMKDQSAKWLQTVEEGRGVQVSVANSATTIASSSVEITKATTGLYSRLSQLPNELIQAEQAFATSVRDMEAEMKRVSTAFLDQGKALDKSLEALRQSESRAAQDSVDLINQLGQLRHVLSEWLALGSAVQETNAKQSDWMKDQSAKWLQAVEEGRGVHVSVANSATTIASSSAEITKATTALYSRLSQLPNELIQAEQAFATSVRDMEAEMKQVSTAFLDQGKALDKSLEALRQSESRAAQDSADLISQLGQLRHALTALASADTQALHADAMSHLDELTSVTTQSSTNMLSALGNIEKTMQAFDHRVAGPTGGMSELQAGLRTVEAAAANLANTHTALSAAISELAINVAARPFAFNIPGDDLRPSHTRRPGLIATIFAWFRQS